MADRAIDFAASPTLTTLRDEIGEGPTVKLVMAKGGTDVYLPDRATDDCALARIIGYEAVATLIEIFGGHRHLEIPTGRGLAHGRRIDPERVRYLSQVLRLSVDQIAREVGCTARQVRNILGKYRALDDARQLTMF